MTDMSSGLRNASLRQLRVFATVARLQNFTAAARELHLTQPAVSMQVKELEQQCGMALFERAGRHVKLTEAGEELARCAQVMAEELRQTQENLDAMRGLRKGLLKLGAVSTTKYFAPSLLSAFTEEHPEVTVRFSVANREEMIRQLAGNEADLVVMGRPPREIETVSESFARHPLVVIASPSHPLVGKRRIPLSRLAKENFIIREPGSGTRASMEKLFASHGLEFQASMEASSNETIKQAVMAGMGISLLSGHTVGLELKTGLVAMLNVAGLPIMRDWYVMHLRSKQLSPIAAAFRQFLLDHGARIIATAVDYEVQARSRHA